MLLRLVKRLEDLRSYVSCERVLEALADANRGADAERVAAWLEQAVRDGRLFADTRNQLDPASGAIVETRLYRVNHRHPHVAELDEPNA